MLSPYAWNEIRGLHWYSTPPPPPPAKEISGVCPVPPVCAPPISARPKILHFSKIAPCTSGPANTMLTFGLPGFPDAYEPGKKDPSAVTPKNRPKLRFTPDR